MLMSIMLPVHVVIVPQYVLFSQLDWINTYLPLVIPKMLATDAFFVFLMVQFIRGIPRELDEAATVDGASTWQVIREVIFPLARPGLAVTLILTWVFAWNEFLLAATLTSFNARTITTGLSEYVTTTGTEWGTMASIAIITLIPALIIFAIVQRHIVAGLTFGAVKE